MYISPIEAKLDGSRGSAREELASIGMETRFGHSYWRPRIPAWVKFEAWVQFTRLGDVQKPMVKS